MKTVRCILLTCMVIVLSMSVMVLAATKKAASSKPVAKKVVVSPAIKANIVIQSFAYKPAPLKEGSNIDMYITFKNKGMVKSNKKEKYKISCSILSGGGFDKQCPIPNTEREFGKQILPGKTLSISLLGAKPARAGTYKIIIAIPGNTGRPFTKILKVSPKFSIKKVPKNNKMLKKANIVVQSFAYKPAPLKEGSNIDMYITFKNKGLAKSRKNAKYKISCLILSGGGPDKQCPIPNTEREFGKQILPGKTLSISLFGARPSKAGTYKIIIAASNNTGRPYSKILTVAPKKSLKKAAKFKKLAKKGAPKGVLKGIDEGIRITSPSLGSAYMPGDTITLNFQFRPDIDPIPIREILLYNGTTLAFTVPVDQIPPTSRTMSISYPLPYDWPASMNYNIVIRASDSIWGQSDNFRIGITIMGTMRTLPPHGLRVTVEGNPSIVNIGENIIVNMEITNSDAPGFMAPSAYLSGYGFYIYIHPENQGRNRMGSWYMPGWTILSRSDDYRSLRVQLSIGESWDENDDYVVTFNHTTNVYGDSAPFSIRPAGVSTGSLNITYPVSETIWVAGRSNDIDFTLYDRSDDSGLYFLVELLKYRHRSASFVLGSSSRARKPTIVHSQTIAPACNTVTGGIGCRLSYIPPEGIPSNLYRASGMGKNYKIRITATERGGEKIATGYSDKFALLDTSNAMDISMRALRVNETGQLQVEYRVLCNEPFSARIPFTIEWPSYSYGGTTVVPVMVNSENGYVWANLGHIRELKPASADGPDIACRVTANKEKEFYEQRDNNNQQAKRIPIVAKHIYFNFVGSDISVNTFYYHDYQRYHCCECVAGFQISNAGYQTVTGEIEIHQTGNWDTGRSGTLRPPYHDNHLITTDYTIAPGDLKNYTQVVQRYLLPDLLWLPSDLVFTFRGDFADFITPNPAVKHLRHRDGL